jgi:hypothetical protein
MKFPYGISDFYKIITKGYFYIDRIDRIPLIEKSGDHLLFLRPRRFGKSLFLSMLRNYYDLAKAEEFEKLFGHLKIGQHPTPKHHQYFVLKWDFSAVSPLGDTHQIQRALYNHINGCIEQFIVHYRNFLDYEIRLHDEANLSATKVKSLSREELLALTVVKRKLAEAVQKLEGYRQTLQTTYGEVLRLRVYSVVAVGFERLVWQEI